MALFRSFSEIVSSMIERLKLLQPNLDTKPGTVARDLFIDIQADQIEQLHRSVVEVSGKQSLASSVGRDLDKLAKNFGIVRKSGSPSGGIVVFTTNSIPTDLAIPNGTTVTAKNGATYRTIGSFVMSTAEKNRFSANATRLRDALNVAGNSDSFAIEIPVQAARAGATGNIAALQIVTSNVRESLKVLNLTAFNSGTNSETDGTFRSRILAIFSGSNTGTSAGYRNAALSVTGVNDTLVVEPGNTLLLRDGTETIEINDGSFRIINSGTGGKVDIYILGLSLVQIIESFVFSDLSSSGNISDERNDFIPGLSGIDKTLTSEERRLQAFATGNIPLQPVDSIISLTGSQSGVFAEKVTAADGTVSGNYELIKDTNVDTGGSPFGFDRIHFISDKKVVDAESIIKPQVNSVDPLKFSDIIELSSIYQDITITGENSDVSSADRTNIKLKHKPVLSASSITNKTTGEVYVIESQNIDTTTGLNEDGRIIISGKTLPTTADILSIDYIWRHFFDGALDYNGIDHLSVFKDDSIADSIDWGISNGIFEEQSLIQETEDGLEKQIETDFNVSRVVSVYAKTTASVVISTVTNSNGTEVDGIVLPTSSSAIDNILSITSSKGIELYNTKAGDGTFSSRTIFLPTDSVGIVNDSVLVDYNKIELFNIENGDGAFFNNIITLPSEDIRIAKDINDKVEDLFLSEESVFIKYVARVDSLLPTVSLSGLPYSGVNTTNRLLDANLSSNSSTNQPIFFNFNDSGSAISIQRFGPTRVTASLSGISNAGKLKIVGTSFTRLTTDITAGVSISGLTFDLNSEIKEILGLTSLPSSIGIARVDFTAKLNSIGQVESEYDLIGYKLEENLYDSKVAEISSSLATTSFILPSTPNNNSIILTSGEKVRVFLLIYNTNDSEELFFSKDGSKITDKIFARIDKISVSSGFRNAIGTLNGSAILFATSQPNDGSLYSANYNFKAPKEGERLTLRYNYNKLITEVSSAIETVRPITADVLIKEAGLLFTDVIGTVLVNEDQLSNATAIIENVSNAVSNLLNSSKLGGIVDYSDIISVATGIVGVDSINIATFNESGKVGKKAFIKALDNQSIAPGNILFTSVSRRNFRLT